MIGETVTRQNLSLGPGTVIGETVTRRDLSLGPGLVIGGGRKRFRGGRPYMQTGNQDYHEHRYEKDRNPYDYAWFPLTVLQARYARLFHNK